MEELIFDKIKHATEVVRIKLLGEFPDTPYTIVINIWNDDDFKVIAQCGDSDDMLHQFIFYTQEPDIVKYSKQKLLSKSIAYDAVGNRIYIPDELRSQISEMMCVSTKELFND